MTEFQAAVAERNCRTRAAAMMRRYNRLLVASTSSPTRCSAWPPSRSPTSSASASSTTDRPITKGIPPFSQYLDDDAVHRRDRADRVSGAGHSTGCAGDARASTTSLRCSSAPSSPVILGLVGSLYFQAYYASDAMKDLGAYEVSRPALALFLVLNVAFTYGCARSSARCSSAAGAPASA